MSGVTLASDCMFCVLREGEGDKESCERFRDCGTEDVCEPPNWLVILCCIARMEGTGGYVLQVAVHIPLKRNVTYVHKRQRNTIPLSTLTMVRDGRPCLNS